MLIPSHRSPGFGLRQPKQPMTRIVVWAPGYTSSARLPLEGGSATPWAQLVAERGFSQALPLENCLWLVGRS